MGGRRTAVAVFVLLAVAGAACGGGQPSEAPAAPGRALVVGDSVMFDAAPAIAAALESGGVAVVQWPVLGFGLTRPAAYYDWRTEWRSLVDDHRPDLVVAMVGGWDFPDLVERGRRFPTGTDGWAERYGQLLDVATEILTSQGAQLYWVTSPPYRTVEPPGALGAVNAAVVASAERHPSARVVDGYGALAGADGAYTDLLPDDRGHLERVRKDDGVHLCSPGAARVGAVVAEAVAGDHGLMVDPGWRDGPWRDDPRYVEGIEGGRCLG